MQIFNSFEQLEKELPKVAELIALENKQQYPNAKFIKAVRGSYYGDPGDTEDLDDVVALFDVDDPNDLLYCWIGHLEDPFIDDYCLFPAAWSLKELDSIK